jgi:hypothetical protein
VELREEKVLKGIMVLFGFSEKDSGIFPSFIHSNNNNEIFLSEDLRLFDDLSDNKIGIRRGLYFSFRHSFFTGFPTMLLDP